LRDQDRASRTYELMTVLHPEVPEESLQGELDRITGYIDAAGGSIIETLRESPWGRRRLAYPIRSGGRDVRDGYYTVWHLNLSPQRVTDVERDLKLNTQVIRYLVVAWEPKPLDEKEIEAAEIAAEDAAAAAYAAAQAAARAAEAAPETAEPAAPAAVEAAAAAEAEEEAPAPAATTAIEPVAAEAAREELLEVAAEAVETAGELAAEARVETLTEEAETLEAAGAELAIEPVADLEERAELVEDAAAALAQADAAAAEAPVSETASGDTEPTVPAGAVRGDGSAECPEDYPVKGNATSMLYHSPGSPSYKRTVAEFCFASTDAAEAAGFNPTKYEAAHEDDE
jgi:ribosomal protein S6